MDGDQPTLFESQARGNPPTAFELQAQYEIQRALDARKAAAVAQWMHDVSGPGWRWFVKILRGMVYSDAYDMAREFERAGWDANRELVDVLESWDYHLRRAHVHAIGEWIKANGAQARYGIGHHVGVPHKRDLTGIVARVNERDGTYTVRIEALGHVREGEMGTQGSIYAWEDVESATDSLAGVPVPAVD